MGDRSCRSPWPLAIASNGNLCCFPMCEKPEGHDGDHQHICRHGQFSHTRTWRVDKPNKKTLIAMLSPSVEEKNNG